jgi:hypothetical protein
MIETIHNSGLRLNSGAFQSNPIPSIHNIFHIPPLNLIRKKKCHIASRKTDLPSTYKSELRSILESYQDYTAFYTDGSKIVARVGATILFNEVYIILKISNSCSIFQQAIAISFAFDIIKRNSIKKAIILIDSLSTLTSIQNFFQPNSIAMKIQNQIAFLKLNAQTIVMIWISSYVGIFGNDLPDTYA